MTWILLGYFLVLIYLSINPEKISDQSSFSSAWFWFCLIPMSKFFFAFLSANNINNSKNMILIEIWNDGFGWLLLGISLFQLSKSFRSHSANQL